MTPTNDDRIRRIYPVIVDYSEDVSDDLPFIEQIIESAVIDLMTDLRLYCDRYGIDLDTIYHITGQRKEYTNADTDE